MLKIGSCTWMFGDLRLDDIVQRLQVLGFDGVELMGDLSLYRPAEAGRTLAAYGLQVLSLTPADVDLPHPDAQVRQQALDYYYKLLDFAAALDRPLVGCHGCVGRIRAISSQAKEYELFVEGVRQVAERARPMGLRLAIEVLNRYEAHLLNTAAQALEFVADVGADNVGLLLDAYHMNIEEADPAAALRQAGDHLYLYHVADSNRQAVGRGHTDFPAQIRALRDAGFTGPIVIECAAPGPDPFTAIKGPDSLPWLETYLGESLRWLRAETNP
jgi:D-psicose/D-tagatose/L-ribulose 3-epimerase